MVNPIINDSFEAILSTFELQTYAFSNSSGTVVVECLPKLSLRHSTCESTFSLPSFTERGVFDLGQALTVLGNIRDDLQLAGGLASDVAPGCAMTINWRHLTLRRCNGVAL
jgi:hypothetical protein